MIHELVQLESIGSIFCHVVGHFSWPWSTTSLQRDCIGRSRVKAQTLRLHTIASRTEPFLQEDTQCVLQVAKVLYLCCAEQREFGKVEAEFTSGAKTTSALLQAGILNCSVDDNTLAIESEHIRTYQRDRTVQKKAIVGCKR